MRLYCVHKWTEFGFGIPSRYCLRCREIWPEGAAEPETPLLEAKTHDIH